MSVASTPSGPRSAARRSRKRPVKPAGGVSESLSGGSVCENARPRSVRSNGPRVPSGRRYQRMTEPRTAGPDAFVIVRSRTAARDDQTANVAFVSRPATGSNVSRARLETDDSIRGGTA